MTLDRDKPWIHKPRTRPLVITTNKSLLFTVMLTICLALNSALTGFSALTVICDKKKLEKNLDYV